MSTAEIILGANLYKNAVDADIPATIKANPDDYADFQLAFRDMSRWLVRHDCIAKDDDGNWDVNNTGIDAVTEKQAEKFLPLYQTTVMAHEKSKAPLTRDGKSDYLADFRELHADTIFEIEPDTVTRVRGDDMQDIASAALNLLDAVDKDRANAAFVNGLDQASIDTLSSIMEDSGYLMPGENPDRAASLGAQVLRGTPEQQEALYFQALSMATNLTPPETINQGDRPAAAAMMFKSTVTNAHVEEVQVDGPNASPDMGWDSDLTRKDCNTLFNVLVASTRMIHATQWDTQSLDTVLAHPSHVEDVKIALAAYHDDHVGDCLGSGNFGDPVIGIEEGKRLAKAVAYLDEAINGDPESERFTGDDGGMLTQEGQTMDEEGEYGDEFANAFDADDTEGSALTVSADGDMAADIYGPAEKKVRLTEALVRQADAPIMESIDNGIAEYLRQRAGRASVEMGDISSSRAAFGTLEDAVGGDRPYQMQIDNANRSGEVVTLAEKASMNPDKRERLESSRRVVIKPGQGAFISYKPGAPGIAAQRMTNYLDNNMLLENGKPNFKLRTELRDATQMRVEAATRGEGEAFISYARKFVERDRQEQQLRKDEAAQKRGITSLDLDAKDVGRFLDVYESSKSTDPALVQMFPDGKASITHPEAPKLESRLASVPKEVQNTPENAPRKFGGMLDVESLKAAYQTGAEKLTILIDGERPMGAIGKFDDQVVKTKSKTRDPEDVVLS